MRKIAMFALLAVSANGFGATDSVHWTGGTGDWMDSGNWTDEAPAPDWIIPGWVVGNPANTNNSTDLEWNKGWAHVNSGTARITPSSAPDGLIPMLYLGGAGGAQIEISADARFGRIYLAEAGQSATITQTAGNVDIGGSLSHIGRFGDAVYNLQGGTLTNSTTTHTFIGVDSGGTGTFNQTGGLFAKIGSGYNIYVGHYAGATGIVNLSGGQFVQGAGSFRLGSNDGAEGYLNISGSANLDVTASGAFFLVGDNGYGEVNQTGGSVEAVNLKIAAASGSDTNGAGRYTISGGTLDIQRYLNLENAGKATFTVEGSGAEHIRMPRLYEAPGTTIRFLLDGSGTTLVEVMGVNPEPLRNAVLNGTVEMGTTAGFDASPGDVFNVLWSGGDLTTGATIFTNIGNRATFSWRVVDMYNGGLDGKMLQLVVESVTSPLDAWMQDYGVSDAAADPDGDGLDNLYEFGVGGDPTNALDTGHSSFYALEGDGSATWLTYVYPKRSDPSSGLAYYIELSDDLASGSWSSNGYEVVGTGSIDADFDAVTNRIPTSSKDAQFVRPVIEEER